MEEKEIFPGITVQAGRRSGKACVAGTRLTVADVLGYLASEMTLEEIIEDFPELNREKIKGVLKYAAARENDLAIIAA